jgi:putative addiction module killer protein
VPIEIQTTETFKNWVKSIRDIKTQSVIGVHLERAALGNLGKIKSVGGNIYEKKIYFGSGYRLYFIKKGDRIILLLCGGAKSTQQKDIKLAQKIAKELL